MNKGGCQKYSLPLALFQSYWHSRFARMTKEWLSGFQCHALLRNKIVPVAIDHEKIFNKGSLDHDIYEQTYVDSIFYSNLYHRLFKNSQSTVELIHEVCATLHEKVSECNDQLDGILDEIPYEWNIDIKELKEKLGRNIFQESWLNKVEATFRNFASLAIKNP